MAKASLDPLRKAENEHWIVNGRAIERAKELSGLSLKQFADALKRDERQVAKWFVAAERPQLETVFAVPQLRCPLVIALAEQAGEQIEVVTEIRVRRA